MLVRLFLLKVCVSVCKTRALSPSLHASHGVDAGWIIDWEEDPASRRYEEEEEEEDGVFLRVAGSSWSSLRPRWNIWMQGNTSHRVSYSLSVTLSSFTTNQTQLCLGLLWAFCYRRPVRTQPRFAASSNACSRLEAIFSDNWTLLTSFSIWGVKKKRTPPHHSTPPPCCTNWSLQTLWSLQESLRSLHDFP